MPGHRTGGDFIPRLCMPRRADVVLEGSVMDPLDPQATEYGLYMDRLSPCCLVAMSDGMNKEKYGSWTSASVGTQRRPLDSEVANDYMKHAGYCSTQEINIELCDSLNPQNLSKKV